MNNFSTLFSLLFCSIVFAQIPLDSLSKTTEREYDKYSYITIGTGINTGKYRDFATTPLQYSGKSLAASVGYERFANKKLFSIEARAMISPYDTSIFKYKSQGANAFVSEVNQFNITSFYLWEILNVGRKWYLREDTRMLDASHRWYLRVGPKVDYFAIIRRNSSLNNNSFGLDEFYSLSGHIQWGYNMRRMSENKWIRTIVPKKSEISVSASIPLLYGYYRNSNYIYLTYQDDQNQGYDYTLYKGWNMQTSIAYTVPFRNNKNAFRLGYNWGIYMTAKGGYPEKFEVSNHTFTCSLLFNIR